MNVTRTNGSKMLATFLVACLTGLLMPSTSAGAPGALTGTVFSHAQTQPLSGVVVHVASIGNKQIFSSTPTAADGAFIVKDLPAGSYEIAIESDGVLYTVGAPIKIGAGNSRQVDLNLDRRADTQDPVAATHLHGMWSNPLAATLVVVGAVVAIGLLADSSTSNDDEDDASPF